MLTAVDFANVVSCDRCAPTTPCLLRDRGENVPQPGYVGDRYASVRVLLVGQNPGRAFAHLVPPDRRYTAALRRLRDAPSNETLNGVTTVLAGFAPSWPIWQYSPLRDCGLELRDVAFFNLVRCRVNGLGKPSDVMVQNCIESHFVHWVDQLAPRVVVFLGKWAYDRAVQLLIDRRIPCDYISRRRNLDAAARAENRVRVVSLVRRVLSRA